jgi:hypothetical protein
MRGMRSNRLIGSSAHAVATWWSPFVDVPMGCLMSAGSKGYASTQASTTYALGAAVPSNYVIRVLIGTVVCVRDPERKRAWYLAASSTEATAQVRPAITADSKDLRFGMDDAGKGFAGVSRKARGTSKRREHSLFRRGCMVYDLIPLCPSVGYSR